LPEEYVIQSSSLAIQFDESPFVPILRTLRSQFSSFLFSTVLWRSRCHSSQHRICLPNLLSPYCMTP
jgi:hypothetical protein